MAVISSSIPAAVRREAEKATLQFDWLVPHKPYFRIAEVSKLTGMGETFIEEHFDASRAYHEYNGGKGTRMSKRIPRAFVIALLINSAKYDAETKRDALLSCLREFTGAELEQIAEAARRIAAAKVRP